MYESAVMPTIEQICLQSADEFDMISGCVLNATNVMQNSNYTQEISFNQQFTNGIIRDIAKIQISDIYCPYCCNLEYNRTHYLPAEQDTVLYDDSKILEILPRQGCEDSTKLIVGIRSAPNEWEDRDWIRNTWAKHYKTNTKIIFLIGKHKKNATINNFVAQENDKYGDILVMGFNDHYYNLTLKDYGFFEYILKHCKNVNCILKPDIDTVNNVPGFELLCDLLPENEQMITGRSWESGVVRNIQSKWYVPKYVYAKENYAPFPVGWTFFISGNGTIEKLQNTIKSKTTFLISENYRRLSDDALIMGDIRILAGIPFQDIGGFGLQQVSYWSDIRTGYQEIPLASEVENHNREEIWQKMKASINYK
uniref:Hexosyltransferase n=1 Tax=Acrobeloides nanus TaxID=290746 RepID=A0A914C904_9BILA